MSTQTLNTRTQALAAAVAAALTRRSGHAFACEEREDGRAATLHAPTLPFALTLRPTGEVYALRWSVRVDYAPTIPDRHDEAKAWREIQRPDEEEARKAATWSGDADAEHVARDIVRVVFPRGEAGAALLRQSEERIKNEERDLCELAERLRGTLGDFVQIEDATGQSQDPHAVRGAVRWGKAVTWGGDFRVTTSGARIESASLSLPAFFAVLHALQNVEAPAAPQKVTEGRGVFVEIGPYEGGAYALEGHAPVVTLPDGRVVAVLADPSGADALATPEALADAFARAEQ